jgi:hypothetical protein
MHADPAAAAREDLAYLRSLVDPSPRSQRTLGVLLTWGGLLYGAQTLIEWGEAAGYYQLAPLPDRIVAIGTTVLYLVIVAIVVWRNRKDGQGGAASRAINAAFAAAGLANLAMAVVIGMSAARYHSLAIWEIYPAVVFALQGAAWLVGSSLRRRSWMGLVGLGWLVNAAALGFVIATPAYVLAASFGLFAWMALPGLALIWAARTRAV